MNSQCPTETRITDLSVQSVQDPYTANVVRTRANTAETQVQRLRYRNVRVVSTCLIAPLPKHIPSVCIMREIINGEKNEEPRSKM